VLAPVLDVRARAVVSNPPYIAMSEATTLPASVRDWEPAVALFGGVDGLAATARLVREAAEVLEPGGVLAVEVDVRRASLVAELVARERRLHAIRVELDLTGRERYVLARRQERGG
jgi:release factor glutamine methyltransferase